LREVFCGSQKKRAFSVSEKSPFQPKSDIFQVWKNRFFRSPRRSKLRQGCSGAQKKLPLLGSEKLLVRFVKTLEMASWLFWRPENATPFRFGKITFSAAKLFLPGSKKFLFPVAKTLDMASG